MPRKALAPPSSRVSPVHEVAMIEVRDVWKAYGAVQAVAGVSFVAKDGLVTGLLGPNGAGKTTTLRVLSSLSKPDAGQALLDAVDATQEPERARATLGVLPDDRGLYPRLTAADHLRYFGQLHGMVKVELERRIDELATLLDMTKLLGRRVEGFSQGERTKVAIGRALIHAPRNVVLDEATNGLDVMSTRAMRTVIRKLAEQGSAVLFSTHVMQEVSALCDHIVVLRQGKVVADGTPSEICSLMAEDSLENAFVRLIGDAAEGSRG